MITTSRPSPLALMTLCVALTFSVAACSSADPGAAPSSDPTPSGSATPSPTPTQPPTETPTGTVTPTEDPTPGPAPEVIAYAGGESPGVEIQVPGDVRNLTGAPASFKKFIRAGVTELQADSTCGDGFVGITVEFLRTDGYAAGGVNDCGGYAALWAVVDGDWTEIAGTQEAWDCAILEQYAVPSDIAGDSCYDYVKQKERHYQQA